MLDDKLRKVQNDNDKLQERIVDLTKSFNKIAKACKMTAERFKRVIIRLEETQKYINNAKRRNMKRLTLNRNWEKN